MDVAIRERREALGLSLTEVAAAAGVSKSYLSELEAGKKPINSNRLRSIARVLRCEPGELLRRNGHPTVSSPGFSDCIVEPWVPPPPSRPGANEAFDPRSLAPAAARPMIFLVRHAAAAPFGIVPGTLLVIDHGPKPPERSLVVVNHADDERAAASTILARYFRQFLVGPRFLSDPTDCVRHDPATMTIYGPVVATLHAPDLLSRG